MSDEVYDADGDISRYLQSPSLESHVLAVPDDHGEPVATHVGAPPQHVPPPVQGSVALPTAPTPLNLSAAPFGNHDVQNHEAMTMDVQPPTLEDSVLPELLGGLSLYDHFPMDDGDDSVDALYKIAEDAGNNHSSAVAAEHSAVFPVEQGLITFVPFVRGQLDCSKCRSVREVLHESANHKLYFIVHVGDPAGTFQHAIIDRACIDATGQIILNELMYADLRERTRGRVQNFIANSVEMLKNDTSGQLTDSCSTSQDKNAMQIQLEMDMLKEILSAPSSNAEAVGSPQSGPEDPHQTVTRAEEDTNADDTVLINAANWPTILESSQVSAQHGMLSSSDASATGYETQLAKQRRRISQLTMKDIAKLMHRKKKDAANELNISVTSLKRLCRKNNTDRWPARKIKSLDDKIKKLEQAALRNVGTKGLLAIKEKMEELKSDKEKVYASVLKAIQENQKNNDSAGGSSG